jgi:hypothetical protein
MAMERVARLKELYEHEKTITVEVIVLLKEIEDSKDYARLGYGSVFKFCIREIGYSEGSAYRRVAAMRLYRRFPETAAKIRNGELSLTNAAFLSSIETESEDQARLLFNAGLGGTSKIAGKRIRALAKMLGLKIRERCELPDSLEEKLGIYGNLVSHLHPNATKEDLLHLLLDEAIERLKPRGDIASEVKDSGKRHVPKKLRDALLLAANHTCSFVSEAGVRCCSGYQLEIDHIIPFALGGRTELPNLRVLCRTHNLWFAEQAGLTRNAG